jgi:small subunit ribosomal protein S4
MARYIGPKTKIARRFKDPIFGPDKSFEKRPTPPGQHGSSRKRTKQTEYAIQLSEKQKAKYTYGVLERQFRRTFESAVRKSGVTGENLLQLLESRLDNIVYRLGISPTRSGARQLVSHGHIALDGIVTTIPSVLVKPGQVISVRGKSQSIHGIQESISANSQNVRKYSWLEWNSAKLEGNFLNYPSIDQIPETINVQLIVELYSK